MIEREEVYKGVKSRECVSHDTKQLTECNRTCITSMDPSLAKRKAKVEGEKMH